MFSNLKNIELLRYKLFEKIDSYFDELNKKNKDSTKLIIETIISTGSSLLSGYISSKYLGDNIDLCKGLMIFVFSILIFVFTFGVLKLINTFVIVQYNKRSPSDGRWTDETRKKAIDDFDHIACDNILICFEFKKRFLEENNNVHLRTFYYYEIIYYLFGSMSKTSYVITMLEDAKDNNKDKDNKNKTPNIDKNRIQNVISMVKDLLAFLDSQETKNAIYSSCDDKLENLKKNYNSILKRINEI